MTEALPKHHKMAVGLYTGHCLIDSNALKLGLNLLDWSSVGLLSGPV